VRLAVDAVTRGEVVVAVEVEEHRGVVEVVPEEERKSSWYVLFMVFISLNPISLTTSIGNILSSPWCLCCTRW
jgi:hypothetical protein